MLLSLYTGYSTGMVWYSTRVKSNTSAPPQSLTDRSLHVTDTNNMHRECLTVHVHCLMNKIVNGNLDLDNGCMLIVTTHHRTYLSVDVPGRGRAGARALTMTSDSSMHCLLILLLHFRWTMCGLHDSLTDQNFSETMHRTYS